MTSGGTDAAGATGALAAERSGDPGVRYAIGLVVPDQAFIAASWHATPPAEGRALKWTGPCTKCTHKHTVEVPDRVVEGVSPQAAPAPVSVQVRMFSCMCPNEHADRPEGVLGGCGRYWLGRIERGADGSYTLSVEMDLDRLPQVQALDAAIRSGDVRARNLAEKWVGGVTALLGLLSVSGIVTGANAPTAVRADLSWLIFTTAALALAFAAAAFIFAYLAAFGSPRNTPVRNQSEQDLWFKRLRSTGARTMRLLKISIVLTLVSLLFAFAVAGLLWFLPREKAPAQCTVQGHGSCQVIGHSVQQPSSALGLSAA